MELEDEARGAGAEASKVRVWQTCGIGAVGDGVTWGGGVGGGGGRGGGGKGAVGRQFTPQ